MVHRASVVVLLAVFLVSAFFSVVVYGQSVVVGDELAGYVKSLQQVGFALGWLMMVLMGLRWIASESSSDRGASKKGMIEIVVGLLVIAAVCDLIWLFCNTAEMATPVLRGRLNCDVRYMCAGRTRPPVITETTGTISTVTTTTSVTASSVSISRTTTTTIAIPTTTTTTTLESCYTVSARIRNGCEFTERVPTWLPNCCGVFYIPPESDAGHYTDSDGVETCCCIHCWDTTDSGGWCC